MLLLFYKQTLYKGRIYWFLMNFKFKNENENIYKNKKTEKINALKQRKKIINYFIFQEVRQIIICSGEGLYWGLVDKILLSKR